MDQTNNIIVKSNRMNVNDLVSDFFTALRRMWVRVLLLAILLGAIFGTHAYLQYVPLYTASATFTVNIKQEQLDGSSSTSSYFDNLAAEQMATTFPHVLTSGVLQRRVARAMGVDYISGTISASVEESTNILTLSVTDQDAERAQETLLAVIENYPEFSEMIVGKVNLKLLDETGVPTETSNTRDWINPMIKGATIGAAVGLIWVAIVSIVRKTIRRESDCIKYVNKVCIGSIPYVREKKRSTKKRRYLNILDETLNPDFKEAIRIVRNKVERSTKEHELKTILVTSALAGEGKSTVAVNLAISLAQEGKRVALVDCDLRNPSDSEMLGLDTKKGLVDYLKQSITIKDCIYTAEALNMASGMKFAFIPGGKAVVDGANYLADERMRFVIKSLEEQMDYVILDSAPVGLMTDAGVLAQYADGALFVVRKDFAGADYILNGMQHLTDNSTHIIGCVINGD